MYSLQEIIQRNDLPLNVRITGGNLSNSGSQNFGVDNIIAVLGFGVKFHVSCQTTCENSNTDLKTFYIDDNEQLLFPSTGSRNISDFFQSRESIFCFGKDEIMHKLHRNQIVKRKQSTTKGQVLLETNNNCLLFMSETMFNTSPSPMSALACVSPCRLLNTDIPSVQLDFVDEKTSKIFNEHVGYPCVPLAERFTTFTSAICVSQKPLQPSDFENSDDGIMVVNNISCLDVSSKQLEQLHVEIIYDGAYSFLSNMVPSFALESVPGFIEGRDLATLVLKERLAIPDNADTCSNGQVFVSHDMAQDSNIHTHRPEYSDKDQMYEQHSISDAFNEEIIHFQDLEVGIDNNFDDESRSYSNEMYNHLKFLSMSDIHRLHNSATERGTNMSDQSETANDEVFRDSIASSTGDESNDYEDAVSVCKGNQVHAASPTDANFIHQIRNDSSDFACVQDIQLPNADSSIEESDYQNTAQFVPNHKAKKVENSSKKVKVVEQNQIAPREQKTPELRRAKSLRRVGVFLELPEATTNYLVHISQHRDITHPLEYDIPIEAKMFEHNENNGIGNIEDSEGYVIIDDDYRKPTRTSSILLKTDSICLTESDELESFQADIDNRSDVLCERISPENEMGLSIEGSVQNERNLNPYGDLTRTLFVIKHKSEDKGQGVDVDQEYVPSRVSTEMLNMNVREIENPTLGSTRCNSKDKRKSDPYVDMSGIVFQRRVEDNENKEASLPCCTNLNQKEEEEKTIELPIEESDQSEDVDQGYVSTRDSTETLNNDIRGKGTASSDSTRWNINDMRQSGPYIDMSGIACQTRADGFEYNVVLPPFHTNGSLHEDEEQEQSTPYINMSEKVFQSGSTGNETSLSFSAEHTLKDKEKCVQEAEEEEGREGRHEGKQEEKVQVVALECAGISVKADKHMQFVQSDSVSLLENSGTYNEKQDLAQEKSNNSRNDECSNTDGITEQNQYFSDMKSLMSVEEYAGVSYWKLELLQKLVRSGITKPQVERAFDVLNLHDNHFNE